ncbi:TPA: polysaccharide biosynthesis protein, partial [Streptococcus suis]
NLLFSTEIFAKYSFAYNLLTLVSIATSAFSVVLFPTLARMNRISLRKNYQLMSEVVLSIFMLSNFLYFPLSIFIEWYLPKYFDSLQFLRIILPGLPLTNLITVLIHNYYKIEGLTLVYFRKSLVVLILSMAGNLFAFYFFGNPVSISISSVVMILYWYIDVE